MKHVFCFCYVLRSSVDLLRHSLGLTINPYETEKVWVDSF